MPNSWRQPLGLLTLFAGGALAYLWLGVPGLAGFGLGMGVLLLSLGIATGYWIGTDATTEHMVTELMRRIRQHRKEDGSHRDAP